MRKTIHLNVSNEIRQQTQIIEKNQTNLNTATICKVILQIKMAAELYTCNSYIEYKLQI